MSGTAAADEHGGQDEKRGGRAQVDGDTNRNEPWTLSSTPEGASRNASCMANQSAEQMYLEYNIEYCNSDDEATLFVIPDEAALAQQEVYEFRSIRPCRASENELVAFGPSNQECSQ